MKSVLKESHYRKYRYNDTFKNVLNYLKNNKKALTEH